MTTHGHYSNKHQSPTYMSWANMKSRCTNPNVPTYESYGGRGITICAEWMYFENFLADMGERPSANYTLERKDNEGNYEPGNCGWATYAEQSLNKRDYKNSRSKQRHVYQVRTGVFRVQVRRQGQLTNLGNYSSLEEACAVRDSYLREIQNV